METYIKAPGAQNDVHRSPPPQGQTSWRRVTALLSTKNCETKKPGFFGFIDSVISPLSLSVVYLFTTAARRYPHLARARRRGDDIHFALQGGRQLDGKLIAR